MNHTFQTLEFDHIRKKLMDFAHTEEAKERIQELVPAMKEGEVKKSLKDTTEARIILDKVGQPPAVSMSGFTEILITVRQGGCLTAKELEETGAMLTGVKRFKDFLKRCCYLELGLPYYEQNLDELEELRCRISESVRNQRVEDSASKELKSIRQGLERLEEKLRTKAETILRANKKYVSDSYVTVRNGKICLPVKKDYKASVPGSVIGQSSTGSTLFIEPAAVAKLNEELEILKLEEENEVRRILYELTACVEDSIETLEENKKVLEKLDFLFAKGELSASMNGICPMVNTERQILIKGGRHPLMNQAEAVPLDFKLGKEGRGIVITGPNTGGKTVAIKTVGLFCLMAQCGLHVPCEEAELCMNSQVLCDIGDGQNITENLSTFSAHITNVLKILNEVDEESLVIMDELGSGTDPAEGMGIAIAILEELRRRGCLFLATTHYPEVKVYASRAGGVTNARMAFDKDTLRPLYRLEIGEAGESCALFIAKRLGLSEEMTERARKAAYGDMEAIWKEGQESGTAQDRIRKGSRIVKQKSIQDHKNLIKEKFAVGDSVLVLPDKKKGIVCCKANDKGIVRVQMPGKKIWINQKRVKLLVAADQLYPEDYDFSIVFDTVENRKARHQMGKNYQAGLEIRMADQGWDQ